MRKRENMKAEEKGRDEGGGGRQLVEEIVGETQAEPYREKIKEWRERSERKIRSERSRSREEVR